MQQKIASHEEEGLQTFAAYSLEMRIFIEMYYKKWAHWEYIANWKEDARG